MLAIIETHPVQYHAPVYRVMAQSGVPLTVLYGSDFSVRGYHDREFGSAFSWDVDLLAGHAHEFLERAADGRAVDYATVRPEGLGTALDRLRPEAVLSLGYHHPYDRAGLRWARRSRTPVIFRGETTDTARKRTWPKQWTRDLILRMTYRRCAAVCPVGEHSKRHYRRLGVTEDRMFFSPYCVSEEPFQTGPEAGAGLRAETRRRLGIPAEARVILFSGKLSRRKGVDLIPEAVRQMEEGGRRKSEGGSQRAEGGRHGIHVVFLGDGVLREELQEACAAARVPATFAGFQNQTQLSPFYHAADVLVLPSREGETWGLVVNEALMHGLPCVVSTGVGCQPDLVEPGVTGEVCATDDTASLSTALMKALALGDDPATAQRCRDRVSRYSVAAAAHGLAAAWEYVRQEDEEKLKAES